MNGVNINDNEHPRLPDDAYLLDHLVRRHPDNPHLAEAARYYFHNSLETVEELHQRYIIRTAANALEPHPPTPYVVDRLIVERSVSIFYGEPGCGKTFSLLSMAVNVASGLSWLGFPVKQVPVLIVDEESGEYRLGKRLGAALRGEGRGAETPISFVSLASFKVDNPNDVEELRRLILQTGAKLVIIDALAPVMDGDENSKEDTQPVFTNLRRLADQVGAAFVIIHHSNRNGGYRGSSAIKGALDLLVLVKKDGDSNVLTFTCEKNRDSEDLTWAGVMTWFAWDTPEETFTIRHYTVTQKPINYPRSVRYILDYLAEHGPSSTPDMIDYAGQENLYSEPTIRGAIGQAKQRGLIIRTNPDEKGRNVAAVWNLAPEREEE